MLFRMRAMPPSVFCWCFACALAATPGAFAQDRGTGIGVIVGEPTGVSLKQWIGPATAIDAAMAWSFDRNTSVQLHGDYLLHDYNIIQLRPGRWPVYYGAGARVKFDDERKRGDRTRTNTRVGLRVPLGVAHLFDDYPLDAFIEVVPILDLAPSASFALNAAIGIRYFFP
jgi:hypothetical protein